MDLIKKHKKTFVICTVCVMVLIILISIIINATAPHRAENKMKAAIESKDIYEIINTYEEYCGDIASYSENVKEAVKSAVSDYYDTVYNDINNHDPFENRADFNKYLTNNFGTTVTSSDYEETILDYCTSYYDFGGVVTNTGLCDLFISRSEYISGCECFNSGDYESAIEHFKKVDPIDNAKDSANKKIKECENKIADQEINTVKAYIKKGELEEAEEYLSYIENDISTGKMSDIREEIKEARLSIIDKYCDDEKFNDAANYIETLDSSIQEDGKKRLKEGKVKKAKEYLKKAENALKEKDREEVDEMASKALELGESDKSVVKKAKYYKSFAPFKMYLGVNALTYHCTSASNLISGIYFNRDDKSNTGEKYSNCIHFEVENNNYAEITYKLDKKYDKVSGTYFLDNWNKNLVRENDRIVIYGDGKKLFTSDNITAGCIPKKFKVNVKNVDVLQVKLVAGKNGDFSACVRISNLVATKDFPK